MRSEYSARFGQRRPTRFVAAAGTAAVAFLSAATLLATAMTPARAETQSSASAPATAPAKGSAADNTLTAKEKADGWKLLFDGKTTNGWRIYGKQGTPESWKAVDGVLTRVEKDGDLISVDEFENFELSIDSRIPEGANSGIFFHGVEKPNTPIYYSAPEYQLLDDQRHPDAKNGPTHQCGANYDLIAISKPVCKPAGEWNSTRIVVRGPHVEHWLNGEKVVEYELWSDAWKQLVAKSKFKQWPDYGMAKTGHLGLQEHGFKVEFKNIKIKVLPNT